MALFRAAIKRNSVSLFGFPLLSHIQIISCAIFLVFLVCRLKYPNSCCFFFYSFESFSLYRQLMVFYWSVSDSKSQELFSVCWPILVMMLSRWSLLVLWFLSLQASLSILWGLIQVHLLQLVSPSPSFFIGIFFSSLVMSKFFNYFFIR